MCTCRSLHSSLVAPASERPVCISPLPLLPLGGCGKVLTIGIVRVAARRGRTFTFTDRLRTCQRKRQARPTGSFRPPLTARRGLRTNTNGLPALPTDAQIPALSSAHHGRQRSHEAFSALTSLDHDGATTTASQVFPRFAARDSQHHLQMDLSQRSVSSPTTRQTQRWIPPDERPLHTPRDMSPNPPGSLVTAAR